LRAVDRWLRCRARAPPAAPTPRRPAVDPRRRECVRRPESSRPLQPA